ncbi:MAG: FtsX-like permease family protein [Planctomycetia bacterium]|nr:FtsX-like permease family protein [Planctomycetia bacterium]
MRLRTLLVRQWRNRPGRAVAAAASVAVAVGAVVATWAAADASRAGYRRLTETIAGVPSIDITARDGGRFDATLVPRVVDLPGIRAAVPLFYRPTLLRVGESRLREVAVGVDAAALAAAGLLTLESGEPCREDDEVILDATLAKGLGVGVGDEVLFFARRRIARMRITGLATGDSLRWFAEGATVVVDIQALEAMSLSTAEVDRVRIALLADADRARVMAAVAERLPASLVADVPVGRASMADDVLHSANLGLDFVTALTLAMSWFIVGNAMLMNVAERRRGLSLVRLLGATGRQVRRFVVLEAAILGGVGSIVGAALGLAAAGPISAGISQALQTPPAGLAVEPWLVPFAIVMGVFLAVAAAWWPAREATSLDLLEGLAAAPTAAPPSASRNLLVAAAALTVVAAVSEALMYVGVWPPRASVVSGIALLLAFVSLTPFLLIPLVRLLGRLVPSRWQVEGRLAVDQIVRQPIRTALTAGVLVVAVSNGIGLGHAIRDSVEDVLAWYGKMLKADWVLTQAGALSVSREERGADSRRMERIVRELAGVADVEGIGVATGRVAGSVCVVIARDMPDDKPLPLEPVGATIDEVRQALARGEAVAGTVLAQRAGVKAGDEVVVEVSGRATPVKVAALVVDYTSGGASLQLRRDAARKIFGMEAADVLLVTAEPGRAAALREPLEAIAREHSMLLRSFGELRRYIDRIVTGVVGSLWSILGLGFVVGSLGVANTVTMNVLEKKRSLGLLRAVGMRRGQVVRMVVLESIMLGIAGGIIGLVAGLTTALFIQLASQPLLGHPLRFHVRPDIIAVNLLAAVVVTALAAWLPARRAVRLDLLESISAE